MVKCLPEFEYFYCVLEKTNIISKIRRSKVTDYAALNMHAQLSTGTRDSNLELSLNLG